MFRSGTQKQRDTETHTKVNYQYIKETKIHTLQNSIISILKLHRQYRCLVIFDKLLESKNLRWGIQKLWDR